MIAHLNVHSYFSFLEGLASPEELVEAATRFEMPALALTDHNRFSGAVEFHEACKNAGIQSILGLEVDFHPPVEWFPNAQNISGRCVLLAENLDGWSNLCRLSSILQSDPLHPVPLKPQHLIENNAGLLCMVNGVNCLSGYPNGEMGEEKLQDILGSVRRLIKIASPIRFSNLISQFCQLLLRLRALFSLPGQVSHLFLQPLTSIPLAIQGGL